METWTFCVDLEHLNGVIPYWKIDDFVNSHRDPLAG